MLPDDRRALAALADLVRLHTPARPPVAAPTTRELDVLRGYAAGLTPHQIAQHEGLHPDSVQRSLFGLLDKFAVSTACALGMRVAVLGLAIDEQQRVARLGACLVEDERPWYNAEPWPGRRHDPDREAMERRD